VLLKWAREQSIKCAGVLKWVFENIQKYSKTFKKRANFRVETFENIRKYSKIFKNVQKYSNLLGRTG